MRQHCIKTFDVNDSPQNVSVDLLVSREADDLAAHGLQQSIPMRSVDDKNSFSDNFLRDRALRCKNKIGCRGSISQNAPEPFSTRNFMWKVCTCRLIKHKMYTFVSFIDYGILVMDCEHDWITADCAVKCNKHQTNSTYATPLPIFSIFLRRGFLIHKSTYLCFFLFLELSKKFLLRFSFFFSSAEEDSFLLAFLECHQHDWHFSRTNFRQIACLKRDLFRGWEINWKTFFLNRWTSEFTFPGVNI